MARTDNMRDTQLNFFEDHMKHAGEQTRKAVLSSWAGPFGDRVYPKIDESMFDPIYSTHGRPASPTNDLVGACMLQVLLGISEEDLFLRMLTDLTFQYALHRTTEEKLPFSKVTLRRFKTRLWHHFEATGDDLFGVCCQDVFERMKKEEKPMSRFLRRIGKLTVQDLVLPDGKKAGHMSGDAAKEETAKEKDSGQDLSGREGRKDETETGTCSGGTAGCTDDTGGSGRSADIQGAGH
ncbi:MAG: transposase [Clostridia bacterium]|nr:transposase [Clostridia bacterium]